MRSTEIVSFSNSQFNVRNALNTAVIDNTDLTAGSSKLTISDDGFYLTSDGYINLDFDSVKDLQGSEVRFSVDINATEIGTDTNRDTIYLYFDNGKAINLMSGSCTYGSGSKYNASSGGSTILADSRKKYIHGHHIDVVLRANASIYLYIDSELVGSCYSDVTCSKIIGAKLRDRTSNGFKNVSFTNLSLSSDIEYKDPTIEDNCIVLDKSDSKTIEFNPGESSDYELSFTGFTDYCVRALSGRCIWEEFARINFSGGYYVSFKLYVAKGASGTISAEDGLVTHLYKGSKLVNNTAGLQLTNANYPAETYGTQLIGTDVVYKVIKKGNTVQFCYNDKILNVNVGEDIGSVKSVVFSGQNEYGVFKFSNIEYTDNEFNDQIFEITKPEEIYAGEDFTLTATLKAEFKNVEYLWDTGETTPSITLNRETEGLYSNSCTASYNGYSVTKTIEYSVLSSEVDFSGILGYQNTVCGGLYKNTQKDEVKPQFSSVTSFNYDDPKLYFKAYSASDTSIAGFKTNFFDLSSDIDNITLEYDINCPISTQRRSYPAEPLMYLRIQANRWIYVWNEEVPSYSNRFCEYIGTTDRNGESSNSQIYEVNGLIVTNSEIHAKVQISPSKVILNLSFDGKTVTRTYNYAVDKRFLGWSFLRLTHSVNYLNPNFTFYVKNFVAYASDYDLTTSVRNEILKKSKEDLDAYLESLDEETETPELSKYEIAKFDGSSFVKRNHNNPKYNLNVDVSKIENGIRLTGESNQKFDFRDTLHLQGLENTLSFNIKYDDIVQGEGYVLYHIFLNNGYLITFGATQISFYSYSTIFYVNFTNETNKKTGLSLNGKNIRATFTNGNVKVYADDELIYDYSSANVTNYISGFMVNSRVGIATNCEMTNLSLTSDINQTDIHNIAKIENNKIVRENETVDFETNEITNIENDVISVYTETQTTLTSTSIPLTPSEDWEDIYVDFDVQLNPFSKECSLPQYPMQYLFALQYQQNALLTSKLWCNNSSSDKLTNFGFENEKFSGFIQNYNELSYVNNVLVSKLFTKTSWNHVTVRIKKSQVITYIDFYNDESNEHNYYSYAQNLTISPEYLNLYFALSSTAVRPLQNVFENKYRNIKVNYVNPDLKLEIVKSDDNIYEFSDFCLTANVSNNIGNEIYLWDSGETESSISLNKDVKGTYSSSCLVKCNSYIIEKTFEYEVLENNFEFKGKIIGFQNTISPNIFYNYFNNEINTDIANICYFETNNNKLYSYATTQSQSNKDSNFKINYYDLKSIKNNVTIEYNLKCPIIVTNGADYGRCPIMGLRISENQYFQIFKHAIGGDLNHYYAYLYTFNGTKYTSSQKEAIGAIYATNSETKVKIDVSPDKFIMYLNFDGKTVTKTYNMNIDKNYLAFILYGAYDISDTRNHFRLGMEFYISDFIAYETGYEITEDDKAKIAEMMASQNEDYVAEHGKTVIPAPEITFNNVALEDEVGKTATITASGTNALSYSWDSGETSASISKIYEKEKTYTVTALGKASKTSSKSITIKGIVPELDEHVMWKLNPYNAKYFYYRDESGMNYGEIKTTGNLSVSGGYIGYVSGTNHTIIINDSNNVCPGSLCKVKLNCKRTSYDKTCIKLNHGYYISFEGTSMNLYDSDNKILGGCWGSGSGDERFRYYNFEIIIKGNIIEFYGAGSKRLKYILDEANDLKFEKIEYYYIGSGASWSLSSFEIQSLDVAEPNIEVVTSNENAQCFEDVTLQIGVDQPCGIVCNGEECAGKFTKKYVETSLFSIKATNKLDNSLYKEIEYTQNVKELVNDINIKNELGLVKLYQNQNVDAEYKLPTTLPENAVIKYYIDGKEVK